MKIIFAMFLVAAIALPAMSQTKTGNRYKNSGGDLDDRLPDKPQPANSVKLDDDGNKITTIYTSCNVCDRKGKNYQPNRSVKYKICDTCSGKGWLPKTTTVAAALVKTNNTNNAVNTVERNTPPPQEANQSKKARVRSVRGKTPLEQNVDQSIKYFAIEEKSTNKVTKITDEFISIEITDSDSGEKSVIHVYDAPKAGIALEKEWYNDIKNGLRCVKVYNVGKTRNPVGESDADQIDKYTADKDEATAYHQGLMPKQ